MEDSIRRSCGSSSSGLACLFIGMVNGRWLDDRSRMTREHLHSIPQLLIALDLALRGCLKLP